MKRYIKVDNKTFKVEKRKIAVTIPPKQENDEDEAVINVTLDIVIDRNNILSTKVNK